MKKRLIFVACLLMTCLSGCEMLNFSIPNIPVSATKLNVDVRSIAVTYAKEDEQKGRVTQYASKSIPSVWKSALQDALDKMEVLSKDAPLKVNLSVKILKLDVPAFGIAFTTDTMARYSLMNRANGAIVYTHDFDTAARVPFNYAFYGAKRAKESINRAVRKNIDLFLRSLKTAHLPKPKPVALNAASASTRHFKRRNIWSMCS